MFTIDQIRAAHSKVKSGADFPAYILEIKQLGVKGYDTFVADGHCRYRGEADFALSSPPKYGSKWIARESNGPAFISDLKEHQLGKTDYLTFCSLAAAHGVEKWVVDTDKMTCGYYDSLGTVLLVEIIPAP